MISLPAPQYVCQPLYNTKDPRASLNNSAPVGGGGVSAPQPPHHPWTPHPPLSDWGNIFWNFRLMKIFSSAFGAGPFRAKYCFSAFGADQDSGPVGAVGGSGPPTPTLK